MVFSSITFLTVFLPATVVLYYLPLPFLRKNTDCHFYKSYKNTVLCLASLVFYAWGEPRNIVLMLLSIVFNFTVALHLDKYERGCIRRKALMVFSLIFNLGLLVFFKYSGFVTENIEALTGCKYGYSDPALPIGISFYTFQILSYVIDVYKGKTPVQRNIRDFALYISMFPQLIAGPIVQYSDIDTQLSLRKESFRCFSDGIFIFCAGLAKKTILANTAGAVFNEFTAAGIGEMSALGAWSAVIFYAFQIYFDFSGYSDMAIGLGRMFGFEFPVNFNRPYTADSITDFWRRWHITLSFWFRDYVYIPLGGNRCSVPRNIFNLFVVWSLTGLWHGASWNFLLWGIYYFVLLVLEKYILGGIISKIPVILRRIITFIFVLFGWVLFFCTDLSDIFRFVFDMFAVNGLISSDTVYLLYSNLVMLLIMSVTSSGLFSYRKRTENIGNTTVKYIIATVLLAVSVIYLIGQSYNPFLYFRF